MLLLVSSLSSGIGVREASSARGGTLVVNCPGGAFLMGFVKFLDHFLREAVESPQGWMLFLKDFFQPHQPDGGKNYLACVPRVSESIISVAFPGLEVH